MKSSILTLVFILVAYSCARKVSLEKDVKNFQIVGRDMDLNGCRASAGYTWSVVRKECIRIFEKGTRLNPVEDQKDNANSLSAFVVFDDQGNKAELFLPNQKKSIVLDRKSQGQPWVKNGWQLLFGKTYILKKERNIIYTGQ